MRPMIVSRTSSRSGRRTILVWSTPHMMAHPQSGVSNMLHATYEKLYSPPVIGRPHEWGRERVAGRGVGTVFSLGSFFLVLRAGCTSAPPPDQPPPTQTPPATTGAPTPGGSTGSTSAATTAPAGPTGG